VLHSAHDSSALRERAPPMLCASHDIGPLHLKRCEPTASLRIALCTPFRHREPQFWPFEVPLLASHWSTTAERYRGGEVELPWRRRVEVRWTELGASKMTMKVARLVDGPLESRNRRRS